MRFARNFHGFLVDAEINKERGNFICPQCNIEHAPREEFCRKCGKFLLSVEDPVPKEEKIEGNLICPKCQVLYEKGNYCRRCGSLLVQPTPTQEANVQPLEKKGVKRRSKEWLSLFKERKELESCMSKLEAQEDRISSDVIHPMLAHYRDRLNSLLPVLQEIEAELESIGEKTSEEIDFFESKLKPVQKRLEEFQSLYGSGAVMKADFLREKNELRKEIKSIERSLVTFRKILSLLPDRMSGNMVSSGSTGHLLQPATLAAATVIILLVMAGAGLLWQRHAQSTRPILTEVITSPSPSLRSPANRHARPHLAPALQDHPQGGRKAGEARLVSFVERLVVAFVHELHGPENLAAAVR